MSLKLSFYKVLVDDTQYEIFDNQINFFMTAVTLTILGLEGDWSVVWWETVCV